MEDESDERCNHKWRQLRTDNEDCMEDGVDFYCVYCLKTKHLEPNKIWPDLESEE